MYSIHLLHADYYELEHCIHWSLSMVVLVSLKMQLFIWALIGKKTYWTNDTLILILTIYIFPSSQLSSPNINNGRLKTVHTHT